MKVIVIGASGTLGSAIISALSVRNEVVATGRRHEVPCDMTDEKSLHQFFKQMGKFHAVVAAAGHAHFEEFSQMTAAKYQIGLNDKLMGQVNVVLVGRNYIADEGSFTLTSGIIGDYPIRGGTASAMADGGVNYFVQAAAPEMPRGIRINAVSPTLLKESEAKFGIYFPGIETISAERAALGYVRSVEGIQTGQIYRIGY